MKKRILTGLLAGLMVAALAVGPAIAQEAETSGEAAVVEVTGIEYAFQNLPTSVPAGTSLGFANGGAEVHELALARINDGVTETLDELLAMGDPEAAGLVEMLGEPIFALPGESAEGTFALEQEGRYVVLCFVPQGVTPSVMADLGVTIDMSPEEFPPEALEFMAGQPPHAALGMVQEFIVTAAGTEPGPLPEMEATEDAAEDAADDAGDEIPAVQVSGVVVFAATDPVEPPTSVTIDGAATKYFGNSAVRQLTMNDERLSGSQRAVWNLFDYGTDGSTVAGRLSIENDAGSWQGTYQGVHFPHAPGVARHQAVLVGEGEYEGLSAVLYYDPANTDDTLAVDGLIFQGEMPDYPALD